MKKSLFIKAAAIALSAVLTVTGLSGCGKKEADKDENGRIKISVGDWPSKEGTELDNVNALKERYEKANPQYVIVPDYWSFALNTFYAKAAGGNLPMVFKTNFTEVSQVIAAGYSADLTEMLKKHGLYDKFNKNVFSAVSKYGRMYGFPFLAYALGMGCNMDLMQAAGLVEADGTPKQPKDWEEVREFAVKIKEKTGKPGIVFPSANNSGGWMFMPLAWSYGVEFMKKGDDGKWKATFDCPEAVEALQYIKDLKWKYDVVPSNALIDNSEYYKLIGTGNAGLYLASSEYSGSVIQYGMEPEQIGMLAMPKGPKKHITLLGGGVYFVAPNATEEQIDGALKWLEMSYTPEISEDYKLSYVNAVDVKLKKNIAVGVKSMTVWNGETDTVKLRDEVINQKANININHVKHYNDFVEDMGDCQLKPEEPVCAQELYGILDGCIQEVLTNKDADCAALIKKASSDFQMNYLDNADY